MGRKQEIKSILFNFGDVLEGMKLNVPEEGRKQEKESIRRCKNKDH